MTSPPYWGLRKYAGEQGLGEFPELGLEKTPEEHIERMVHIFREVRRVLRDDGVCWLNYGDCYSGAGHGPDAKAGIKGWDGSGIPNKANAPQGSLMLMPHRLAIALQDDGWIVRNDLVWFKRNPMPESVAGWRWERSRSKTRGASSVQYGQEVSIVDAHKQDVTDGKTLQFNTQYKPAEYEYGPDYVLRRGSWRHTRAHEYVFQLVKGMGYYCNQEAVREAHEPSSIERFKNAKFGKARPAENKLVGTQFNKWLETEGMKPSAGRNPRSVLDVPTAPYKGAHYATFPPNLIAPLIRASVPRRCCPECGAAWAVVEKVGGPENRRWTDHSLDDTHGKYHRTSITGKLQGTAMVEAWRNTKINVTAYRPTCECTCKVCKGIGHSAPNGVPKSCPVCAGAGHPEPVPGTVLDIFGGSGTTGAVAKELMRNWIVMDISRPYLDEQARLRTGSGTPKAALEGLPLFGGNDEYQNNL